MTHIQRQYTSNNFSEVENKLTTCLNPAFLFSGLSFTNSDQHSQCCCFSDVVLNLAMMLPGFVMFTFLIENGN